MIPLHEQIRLRAARVTGKTYLEVYQRTKGVDPQKLIIPPTIEAPRQTTTLTVSKPPLGGGRDPSGKMIPLHEQIMTRAATVTQASPFEVQKDIIRTTTFQEPEVDPFNIYDPETWNLSAPNLPFSGLGDIFGGVGDTLKNTGYLIAAALVGVAVVYLFGKGLTAAKQVKRR